MLKFAIALILLAFASSSIVVSETNYYWRDYTGKIPSDAVEGGKNINGDKIYIGQAYVKDGGLMAAQINRGVTYVYAEYYGSKRANDYIKILCGPSENFAWIRTNSSNLHLDLLNKNPIIGGHHDGFGIMNVGRIFHEGGAQIGKINSHDIGNAILYYADKTGKAGSASSYEVLLYVDTKPL